MRDTEVNNGMDIIDSRDIIKRIEELESYREDAQATAQEKVDRFAELHAKDELTEDEQEELREYSPPEKEIVGHGRSLDDNTEQYTSVDWDEETYNELEILKALADEGEGCSDWSHGETLIRDSYFETYAEELAEDIGAIGKDTQWPLSYIDWEAAANALKQDYTCVDFDGVEYWIRS